MAILTKSACNDTLKKIRRNKGKIIFYCVMAILPILQFLVFYLYINFNSFVLAFQTLDMETGAYSFAKLENFKQIFTNLKDEPYLATYLWNSLEIFLITVFVGGFAAIFFSYYIFKKYALGGFFKFVLYMPQILSVVVFVIMYKYFVEVAIPWFSLEYLGKELDPLLLPGSSTAKPVVIFFSLWLGFGSQVLIYSSAMSGVSDSLIESAALEGITPLKELFLIVLPCIWGTYVTFMLLSIAALFTNQNNLYTFFGPSADSRISTLGYYTYNLTLNGTVSDYNYLSAFGMLESLICIPLTFLVRYLLNRFGPSAE